ncbi:MAG: hypothetical protein OER82_05305 [Nitrosopumilus sp.]|nr:hypothetical protein [Nitrosopumilus sp.]
MGSFLVDYKDENPSTKIHIITHSLGAQVALSTLKHLHGDPIWNAKNYKVDSIHLMGAAVDNESPDDFSDEITEEVEYFYNLFNVQDDVLEFIYPLVAVDFALGEVGSEDTELNPSNYYEKNVSLHISLDTDGDGDNDVRNLGDNHSGYVGVVHETNGVTSDGAMDLIVDDWSNPPFTEIPIIGVTPQEKLDDLKDAFTSFTTLDPPTLNTVEVTVVHKVLDLAINLLNAGLSSHACNTLDRLTDLAIGDANGDDAVFFEYHQRVTEPINEIQT